MRGLRPTVAVLALLLLGGCADTAQPPAGAGSSAAAPVPGPGRTQDPTAAEPPTADLDSAAEDPAAAGAGPDAPASRSGGPGSPGRDDRAEQAVPTIEVRDATRPAEVVAPIAPTRFVYEALDVDMPVDAVGVAPDGQMEIPEDAARAGWYRFGPQAGADRGTAVVAAHAGSHITPQGPLYELPDARPGDRITLKNADGSRAVYEVTTVEQTAKTAIDWSSHFQRDGDPRLVLVTCGGEWDAQRQSYDDNVTVTATLVGE